MRTVSISKNLAAAVANGIAQSQSLASAGTLTLNGTLVTGGVANLGSQRRVAIVSGGNDSGKTVTLVGTRETNNQPLTEVVALANAGTVTTVGDFFTVGTITSSASIASTITIGTNGTGSTDWIMPNYHLTPFDVTLDTEVSGTVAYNIETTQDDYFTAQPTMPTVNVHQVVTGGTAAAETVLSTAVRGYRYTITSGTGTLTAQGTQAGISNY